MKTLRLALALAALLLTGCGAVPGAGLGVAQTATDGTIRLGFGAEGGESPAVCLRRDGSVVVAYAGTNTGDRRIYWTQSSDGRAFAATRPVDAADYSDQSPRLVEDRSGALHLFFASNRTGDDFRLYHSLLEGDAWSAPAEVPGFEGLQGLAVAYDAGRFLMAAEIMGSGLFATTSADGTAFTERERLSAMGFEPAATFLPGGKALVAYQHHGKIFYRASAPGTDWSPEAEAASGGDRLRTPAITWAGDHGELVYAERAAGSYRLAGVRFDSSLKFGGSLALPTLSGQVRTPALASDGHARTGLAWGIKLSSGQEGIVLAVQGDR